MMDFESYFELHLHMEGCIPFEELYALRLDSGETLCEDQMRAKFQYQNFAEFIRLWCEHQKLLFSRSDFEKRLVRVVRSILRKLKASRIEYAEAHISPIDSLYMTVGMSNVLSSSSSYQKILMAWESALSECYQEDPDLPKVRLIVDLVRNYPMEVFNFQVEQLMKNHHNLSHVFAFGLGGGCDEKSLLPFCDGFTRLQELGLRTFVHAGEQLPEEVARREVREAMALGANRIGHGIHCYQDQDLLDELCDRNLPLEICLTSNLMTQTIEDLRVHPLLIFMDAGVPVVLSTDDPVYFQTTLEKEYGLLESVFELDNESIEEIWRNSVEYSFAPWDMKQKAIRSRE